MRRTRRVRRALVQSENQSLRRMRRTRPTRTQITLRATLQ
jgi:hypothetical protein